MASNTPREYMVGFGVSSRGKPMAWARDPHAPLTSGVKEVFFERMEMLVPGDVRRRLTEIELLRDVSTVANQASEVSTARCDTDSIGKPSHAATSRRTVTLVRGQVATHCDGQGSHRALILRPGPMTLALFVTSNPRWSKRSRPLADDEAALLGKPVGNVNYLAPVIREASDFVPTRTTFPAHRTEALLVEFFDPER